MSYDISIGEIRVRTEFNPSNTEKVDLIKQKTAELINLVESLDGNRGGSKSGVGRLKDLSMTAYEEAAMWAVKAATA